MKPSLTFFCELESHRLAEIFNDDSVVKALRSLRASISLGILDFSPERTSIVRLLNKAGIPVTAWLLLPEKQGYWFNLDNVRSAVQRYKEFLTWTDENKLQWNRIGLDIEPDINFINLLMNKKAYWLLLKKIFLKYKKNKAEAEYATLLAQMQHDGFSVESYQIPFVIEEKKAKSNILKKVFGIISLAGCAEILMLYSSMFKSKSSGLLQSYTGETSGIAIGSTGGGVVMEGHGELINLSPEEFFRDLRIATETKKPIYIFSLEGCIKQNLLLKLLDFDWDEKPEKHFIEKSIFDFFRIALRFILWLTSNFHWIIILLCLFLIIFLF